MKLNGKPCDPRPDKRGQLDMLKVQWLLFEVKPQPPKQPETEKKP